MIYLRFSWKLLTNPNEIKATNVTKLTTYREPKTCKNILEKDPSYLVLKWTISSANKQRRRIISAKRNVTTNQSKNPTIKAV